MWRRSLDLEGVRGVRGGRNHAGDAATGTFSRRHEEAGGGAAGLTVMAEGITGAGGRMCWLAWSAGYSKRTLAGVVMRPSSGSVAAITASATARPVPSVA
jgi:hypothetical protein